MAVRGNAHVALARLCPPFPPSYVRGLPRRRTHSRRSGMVGNFHAARLGCGPFIYHSGVGHQDNPTWRCVRAGAGKMAAGTITMVPPRCGTDSYEDGDVPKLLMPLSPGEKAPEFMCLPRASRPGCSRWSSPEVPKPIRVLRDTEEWGYGVRQGRTDTYGFRD